MRVINTAIILIIIILFTNIVFAKPVLILSNTSEIRPEALQETTKKEITPENEITNLHKKVVRLAAIYDVDPVIAWDIIMCESEGSSTATHINSSTSIDVSYWQLNVKSHIEYAKKSGYDIYDPEDNLIFGFLLFKSDGVKPWVASARCQNKRLKARNDQLLHLESEHGPQDQPLSAAL